MRETSLDYEARETPFTKALWSGAALAVAAGYSAFARALRRRQPQAPSDPLALGLMASSGFAAWALGLDFALKSGALAVALALSALGAAFVEQASVTSAWRRRQSGAPVAPDTRH
ncbi:hypothetical protein CCR94_02520 [Rhodoblastus sphagnicola]|uniref:Uncharacterized protein n=1 Tax=Rhodoblastus sphagnicola TaxID=333368 RepID=A0A2S6NF48_9HYPH|nr:hypothetical protein [Rhodoblastus sphagnicola]MBB4200130.1 hypothetical protein [Rhodoblastus sphagnicola]PPQ33210.1 hypothetical protein CCR94_02520 [Rhodoblastus sphagnicola]